MKSSIKIILLLIAFISTVSYEMILPWIKATSATSTNLPLGSVLEIYYLYDSQSSVQLILTDMVTQLNITTVTI